MTRPTVVDGTRATRLIEEQRDHRGSDRAHRRASRSASRRPAAPRPHTAATRPGPRPSGQTTGSAPLKATRSSSAGARAPSTTTTRSSSADRALRRDRMLEQRPAIELGEQLASGPESATGPGGQDQACATPASPRGARCRAIPVHQAAPWIRPRAPASRPPSRPWRAATISARIESAVSSPVGAEIEPEWRGQTREFVLAESGRLQALTASGLSPARTHRADEARRRAQRDQQRGVVELGVVREHRDRGPRVDPPEPGEGLPRPGRDDLLGIREPRGGGEPRPRVDDVGAPAGRAGERARAMRRQRPRRTRSTAARTAARGLVEAPDTTA